MKINIELTLEQVNLVYNALAQLPYGQVVDLVEKVKEQTNVQMLNQSDVCEPEQEAQ